MTNKSGNRCLLAFSSSLKQTPARYQENELQLSCSCHLLAGSVCCCLCLRSIAHMVQADYSPFAVMSHSMLDASWCTRGVSPTQLNACFM